MMRARLLCSAALLLAALPVAAVDQAACGLYPAASWSKAEDSDFFVNQGGIPNIVFLVDNSGSINRMAPDGAVNTWGTQGPSYGCASPYADALRYFSPCGQTSQEGRAFNGTVNYGDIAKVCPYLDSGNKIVTGSPGFDPDEYCPGGGASCNGHPNFFDPGYVFHDNDFSGGAWSQESCDRVSTNGIAWACKGFQESGIYPAATSISGYCNAWVQPDNITLTATELTARRASCNTCLATKGYWFSGYYFKNYWSQGDPATADANSSVVACGTTQDCVDHAQGVCVDRATLLTEYNGGDRTAGLCRFPHLYFTGNFLNFHPPKFIALRKVLKDVLMSTVRVRMGLVTFNGSAGGRLINKLNPSCNLVFPPSPSNFDSNRSSLLSSIKAIAFNNSTPLAEALLNVGELYRTPSLTWFNAGYQNSTFENAAATGNQAAICFNCQKSSIIIITDGLSNLDNNIPGTDFAANPMTLAVSKAAGSYVGMSGYNIKGITAADCPLCNTDAEAAEIMPDGKPVSNCDGMNPKKGGCNSSAGAIDNFLPKVAWYLHHLDARKNDEVGADGVAMTGRQGLDIYTIGYGLGGNAQQILEHTAYRDPLSSDRDVGGGLSKSASNVAELKDAINKMFEDVNQRATSFGSASVATLQSSATISTLVPRFDPNKSAAWTGHLYNFKLFSELAAGCKPTVAGEAFDPNDKDCDGRCDSVFLQDGDGSFIQENDDGQFTKNSPAALAPCGPSNHCSSCGAVGTAAAKPVWEAGAKLDATRWSNRNAYTVVDTTKNGKLETNDGMLRLVDDDATAAKLLPYVNAGGGTCTSISVLLAQAGNTADASAIDAELAGTPKRYTTCVRTMIRYLLGADVFDLNGNGNFRDDRPAKLGDIYHSSPMMVYPPFSRSSDVGGRYPDQAIDTLWVGVGAEAAYDQYIATYRQRDRLIVVGANDGFLHAFKAAQFTPGDDPSTAFRVENGWFDEAIGGDEEWAFMPPDLLPKLPLMLGNEHQFYVDATPFVRDVWVDDNHDDLKQASEYHTVVIAGERRGGRHYFALDVTRATRASAANQDPDAKPTFLWIWPQVGDRQTLTVGESWQDTGGAPPTVGPVRLAASTDYLHTGVSDNTPRILDSSGATVPFHERWIAFLSGGFDMSFARGHGVYMVDVWTGRLIWNFEQPSQGSGVAPDDPRWELRFPIAATVGMVSLGLATYSGDPAMHAYFDTASVGDLGGQLWILRFFNPGVIGSAGTVENWVGARLFQGGRVGCTTGCVGQPIFMITNNIINYTNYTYRVLFGTGDRFNLLDTSGGLCGPDNLRACYLQGCTVTVDGVNAIPGNVGKYEGSAAPVKTPACLPLQNTVAPAAGTCWDSAMVTSISITACPNPDPTANDIDTNFTLAMSCSPENETFACTPGATNTDGDKLRLMNPITMGNRFYQFVVFPVPGVGSGAVGREIFSDLAGAKRYDAARLTDCSPNVVAINGSALPTDSPAPTYATIHDDGWYYYFTHVNTVTVNGTQFTSQAIDERVAARGATFGGRVFFQTMQPFTAVEATSKSPCRPNRLQYSYLYGASITTGKPALTDESGLNYIRPVARASVAPPQAPVPHIVVNSEGFSQSALLSQQVGAPPVNIAPSGTQDPSLDFGWIHVDKRLHDCRHSGVAGACESY